MSCEEEISSSKQDGFLSIYD